MFRCLAFALLGSWLTACVGAQYEFELEPEPEVTEALCDDGRDNDFDGLADCQDWRCQQFPVCCTIADVAIRDDFACDDDSGCAIDPAIWTSFGAAMAIPSDSGGALTPNETRSCEAAGAIGMQPLLLREGLSIRVDIDGRLDPLGHLEIGLTLDPEPRDVQGCSDPVSRLVSVRTSPDGCADGACDYELVAFYDELSETSPVLNSKTVEIRVTERNTVAFSDDRGQTFYETPEDIPVPDPAWTVYLYVSGRSASQQIENIEVTAGQRCDVPADWSESTPVFEPNDDLGEFERVWYPAAVTGDELFFAGCGLGGTDQCALSANIGRAVVSPDTGKFQLAEDTVVRGILAGEATQLDFGLLRGESPALGYLSGGGTRTAILIYREVEDRTFEPYAEGTATIAVETGDDGAWDDDEVCCASAVRVEDQVMLWYAGRAQGDPRWRIGVATSTDGVQFDKHPDNPVLTVGGDEHDTNGVLDPEVVYDQRLQVFEMWYTARAFGGVSSIAAARSADGFEWTKFDGNPIVTPDDVGVFAVGSPAVVRQDATERLWLHGYEPGGRTEIYELANDGIDLLDTAVGEE